MRRRLIAVAGVIAFVLGLSLVNDRFFWAVALSGGASAGLASRHLLTAILPPILCVAADSAFVWALGRAILAGLGVAARREYRTLAFGLGLGLFALAVLVEGLCGLLARTPLLVTTVLFAVAGGAALAFGGGERNESPRAPVGGGLRCAVTAVLAYVALHLVVAASAPPTGFDAVSYHLAIPKIYLRLGGIHALPWLMHSHSPHLLEVFYSLPLSLGCDRAAALIHAGVVGALLLATFDVARSELDEKAAWIAAALLAAQPGLQYVAADAHSDGGLAFFHLAAAWALWRWARERHAGWIALAGLFSGLAASCKLTGVVLTAVLALLAFHEGRRDRSHWRDAALFLGIAAAVAAPWYLRTWHLDGNPVWPYLSGVFGGRGEPALLAGSLSRFNDWRFPADLPLLRRYGPQFLLAPLALLSLASGRRHPLPPFLRFLLIPALPLLLSTGRSHEAWRFMLPMYAPLALAAAWFAVRCVSDGGARRWAAVAAITAGVSPALSLAQGNELSYVAAIRSAAHPEMSPREAYLTHALEYYPFYRRVNESLGPGTRVLLYRETRGYYLDADYRWAETTLLREIQAGRVRDVPAARRWLAENGITHLLVHAEPGWGNSFTELTPEEDRLVFGTVESVGQPVLGQGRYRLYRI